MPISSQLKYQHLLWRAGFGPQANNNGKLATGKPTDWFKQLLTSSSGAVKDLDATDPYIKTLLLNQPGSMRKMLKEEDRKRIRQINRDNIKQLNLTWVNEMVHSEAQLQEKMSLFWHGHFACRSQNITYQQSLINTIRKNALGNFGVLLREVSKSAAILNFLNNNQNRKGHPNENFSREVMELFTIGRGHYTETDVKEAARAFTGWSANTDGTFIFRKQVHDDGSKIFFKRTGQFDGDNILDILLEQKATASFITKKLYTFFVNEQPDAARISWLASRFFESKYDIKSLLKDIFTSDWFYDEKNIGSRIKSPVDLLVGIRRMVPMELENEETQLLIQRLLGQILFYPPNVAGWPGGTSWIDSSSLMFRLRIPQLIRDADEIKIKPKEDDDQMMGMMDMEGKVKQKKGGKRSMANGNEVRATIHWDAFTDQFKDVPREKLLESVSAFVLQSPRGISSSLLNNYSDASTRENYIKTLAVQLMCTPEYQMC